MKTEVIQISVASYRFIKIIKSIKSVIKSLLIIVLTTLSLSGSIAQYMDNSTVELFSLDSVDPRADISYNGTFLKEDSRVKSTTIKKEISPATMVPGSTLLLDSIVEEINWGLETSYKRWYYVYNEFHQLDSVICYWYDENGDFMHITEIRKYNSDGQLKRFLCRQPVEADTIIIDYKITADIYYVYDNQGRLVYDSIIHSRIVVSNYLYDSNNRIEYKIEYTHGSKYWKIYKYSYEQTDTSLLTLEQETYDINKSVIPPVFDTITEFSGRWKTHYETFDEKGRRVTLEISGVWNTSCWFMRKCGEEKRFKGEYEYTQWGGLSHATYYINWEGTIEEGEWRDTIHIDNIYDEEGNILLYEKTFWDTRVERWELANRKEYFYTRVPNILGMEKNSFTDLELFPNPVYDKITLKGDFNSSTNFSIVNLAGIILFNGTLTQKTIDVSWLEEGIYMIIIKIDSGLQTRKFVKN